MVCAFKKQYLEYINISVEQFIKIIIDYCNLKYFKLLSNLIVIKFVKIIDSRTFSYYIEAGTLFIYIY